MSALKGRKQQHHYIIVTEFIEKAYENPPTDPVQVKFLSDMLRDSVDIMSNLRTCTMLSSSKRRINEWLEFWAGIIEKEYGSGI